MKITQTLNKQNIGWYFKKFWAEKGARKVYQTDAEKILQEKGIPVVSPKDIFKIKHDYEKIEVVGVREKPIPLNSSHRNWHERPILTYKDNNVLLEGLTQAKILTKSVELEKGLPSNLIIDNVKKLDTRVKEIILSSHVFDAEQKKLPIVKDPNRPAWNFPRTYGITQDRVNTLLLTNLLQLIENSSPLSLVKQRYFVDNALFCFHFERYSDLIQFELKADTFIISSKPLNPISMEATDGLELPDICPIKPTVTLNQENIYEARTVYPLQLSLRKSHPHTIIIYHNEENVKNIFEEPVTETQVFGRSLLKTFTAAASYAKAIYGENVTSLPKPVTVQCIQTNGKLFHFGILQLNTLELEDGNVKNIWYQTEQVPLFENCCYKSGRAVLEGYNNDVVKYLKAFYNNV